MNVKRLNNIFTVNLHQRYLVCLHDLYIYIYIYIHTSYVAMKKGSATNGAKLHKVQVEHAGISCDEIVSNLDKT